MCCVLLQHLNKVHDMDRMGSAGDISQAGNVTVKGVRSVKRSLRQQSQLSVSGTAGQDVNRRRSVAK
jgi:hypothetical protein